MQQENNKPILKEPYVWVDLEMSGLNEHKDVILEIALVLTDGYDLSVRIEGPELAIKASQELLDGMDAWNTEHHTKSGLVQRCLQSTTLIEDADTQVLDFLQKQGVEKGQGLLAGNSVHIDRIFLRKYMPKFVQYLHYRIVDVSTVKELCRRWRPEVFAQAPKKAEAHRALADILESINELEYYRRQFFQPQ